MNHFEWQEGDFEPAQEEASAETPRRWRFAVIISLLLMCTGIMVLWWLQSDAREMRGQVQKTDVSTNLAERPGLEPIAAQVLSTQFRGNLATVEVLVDDPEVDAYSLRQTWFYRYANDAWERLEPNQWLWGPKQVLQTDHFQFVYHELDQEAVNLLASDVERLYVDVLVGLGKQDADNEKTFTIEIVPEPFPANSTQSDRIRLASPRLRPLHPSFTNRDALAWDLAHSIAYQLLRETPLMAGVTSLNTRYMLQCMLPSAIAQRWAPVEPRSEYDRQQYLRSLVDWAGWSGADMSDMGRWSSTDWRKPQYECGTYSDFIVDRFGYEKLGGLVPAADQTYGWQQVIEKGLGIDYDEFQREWRKFVETEYAPAIEGQSAGA